MNGSCQKNISVCHIIAGKGDVGGMETHVLDLTKVLVECGVSVFVITSPELAPFFDKRIKVISINLNRWRKSLFLRIEVNKIIRRIKPMLFHLHGRKTIQIFSKPIKNNHQLVVATLHNIRTKPYLYRNLNGVICVSNIIAQKINNDLKPYVIYNAVPKIITNEVDKTSTATFKHEVCQTVMGAGRFVSVKGFDLLLAAVARIPNLNLWLIGDGPDRTALEKLVKDLDIEDRVWMPGNLARNEVIGLMKKCDLFIISSRHEGGPITLAEALVHRCPVISTQVGFAPELLNPEHLIEEALVEAITEKINQFFNDTEFISSYESLFEASQKRLSIDYMAEETISFYMEILKQYSSNVVSS